MDTTSHNKANNEKHSQENGLIIAAVATKEVLTFSYDLMSVCALSTNLHKYKIGT